MNDRVNALAIPALIAALLSLGAATTTAYAVRFAERYTAFAVDMGVSPEGRSSRATAGTVEFVIERYSTEAEVERLMAALREQGPDKLLTTLQALPRVGFFRTPNSIGYDIRFARKHKGEDGGEVITLATDRYISFWEARNRPRSIDYPFTLVEVRIGPDGKGEGKMSIATKITLDKTNNTLVLENYKSQPVMLTQVTREDAR